MKRLRTYIIHHSYNDVMVITNKYWRSSWVRYNHVWLEVVLPSVTEGLGNRDEYFKSLLKWVVFLKEQKLLICNLLYFVWSLALNDIAYKKRTCFTLKFKKCNSGKQILSFRIFFFIVSTINSCIKLHNYAMVQISIFKNTDYLIKCFPTF